jgi:lipopolysaccharide transport system ATP-binding protein
MNKMIRIENISKEYQIGARQEAGATLRDSLTQMLWMPLDVVRGRRRPAAEKVWALEDVSFEVEEGEVVAIVGRNGAGKSTLLKILSRITEPTSGRIELYGRVGSLLEVGTGFHSELSGRENIYLSGAILGMKKEEIKRKFDEIVEFAEIGKYIDTPVKRYSSGMYMRLAFGVAAHLEPEILLIDEVLAVGDASFQKKCLGKMGEVAKEGRTVLFVSHNMTAVNQLCPRAVMLADGRVVRVGKTSEIVAEYLKAGSDNGGYCVWTDPRRAPGNERIRLSSVRIISNGEATGEVNIDRDVTIEVEFWNYEAGIRNICANIYLLDSVGNTVLSTASAPTANSLLEEWFEKPHPAGIFRSTCTIPANFLNEGLYYITVYIVSIGPVAIEAEAPQVLSFNVFDTGAMREAGGGGWAGVVRIRLPWQTEFLGSASGGGEGPTRGRLGADVEAESKELYQHHSGE